MRRWMIFVSENSIVFLVLGLVIVLFSLFLIKDLNVEAFPDPSPPMVEVVTIYDGRSAEEVEKRITIPIEVALSSMRGMERINSASLYGLSDIKCKFSYDIPYIQARQEVINRLNNITLPDGVQPSIIPSPMGEVLQYTLQGSNNLMELRTLQDWTVGRYIKTAKGVEDVANYGGYIKAYTVKVMPENLIKYGITLSQVIEALSKSNINVGGRTLELGNQYYMVRGIGLIRNVEDIKNNVITYKNGKAVLIKNIAEVGLGNIPRTGIVIYNNQDDVVMGNVIIRRGEKSIPAIKSVHEKVADLNNRILPKGIKVVPYYERWDLIMMVIKKVVENTLIGMLLVAACLLLFLGNWRAAMLTAITVPMSLAITLALIYLGGDSANTLSIGAIDFGIIADIGLVLSENYVRIARKSKSATGPLAKSIGERTLVKAATEVGTPIIMLVLIIVLALLPVFTMKGAERQLFSPMARTYTYALAMGLLLTFTFLTAGIHTFLRGHESREFKFFETMRDYYTKLVESFFKHQRTVLIMTSTVMFVGFLIGFKFIGTQFLPKLDEGNIYMRVTFPYSISLSTTHENAKKVRDILMTFPEIKSVAVRVGRPEDGTDATGPFNSEYNCNLKPYREWKRHITKEELQEEVRGKTSKLFPNTNISVSQYMQDNLEEMTTGVKGENAVKIIGDDLEELDKTAKQVEGRLKKIPGIEDVAVYRELGQPNLIIEVDRATAAALGLTIRDVLDMISAALGGRVASQVVEGDKLFGLYVSFPPEYRTHPDKIASIPIVLPNGGVVPLDRVADVHYSTGASFIYRENFRRYIPVKFSVTAKDLGGTVQKAQRETAQVKMPDGYYFEWSGIFNEMIEAFRRFYISIPISIFLIVMVLYIYYGNMRNVLLTAVAPVCMVFGGLISLLFTGQALSISAVVGFVSVVGISTFNTCILITHYIEVYEETKDRFKATYQTVKDKFRPVLMVGLTASLGLLPASMAQGVGSQIQKPLAIVVVGGMLIGTGIILLVMPLLFKYVRIEK